MGNRFRSNYVPRERKSEEFAPQEPIEVYPVAGGFHAASDWFAVFGRTEEEARVNYAQARDLYREILARPIPRKEDEA